MSYETTMARGLVLQLEGEWREHKRSCPKCNRRRDHCRAGEQIWGPLKDAREELAWNRAQDKLPIPGQQQLF